MVVGGGTEYGTKLWREKEQIWRELVSALCIIRSGHNYVSGDAQMEPTRGTVSRHFWREHSWHVHVEQKANTWKSVATVNTFIIYSTKWQGHIRFMPSLLSDESIIPLHTPKQQSSHTEAHANHHFPWCRISNFPSLDVAPELIQITTSKFTWLDVSTLG